MNGVTYHDYILNSKEFNLARMEMSHIMYVRNKFPEDNVVDIAEKLGISWRTLRRKVIQYGLNFPHKKNKKKTKRYFRSLQRKSFT